METYVMKTEDKVTVRTGALIWYVNYFAEIHPTIFKQKGKRTVKYFALHENAKAFADLLEPLDVKQRHKLLQS